MSPQNGADAPRCAFQNVAGKFFEPATDSGEFATVYHPADKVAISWDGGKSVTSNQIVSLFLQNSSIGTNYLRNDAIKILVNESFIFGTVRWLKDGEICGNTRLNYDWTVPPLSDLNGSRFQLVAQKEEPTGTSPYFSPGFSIIPSVSSAIESRTSSSSTSISTAPTSTTSQPSPVNPITSVSTPASSTARPVSDELSTGAKIGIGIGSFAAVLLVLVGALLLLRRRRRRGSNEERAPPSYDESGTAKPELDGAGIEKVFDRTHEGQVTELHDQSIGEMGTNVEVKAIAELPAHDNRA